MQLQGPGLGKLGCTGCTRPTAQPGTQGVQLAGSLRGLRGATTGILSASPFTMILGFAAGAFVAWRYALGSRASGSVSGHRRRRR